MNVLNTDSLCCCKTNFPPSLLSCNNLDADSHNTSTFQTTLREYLYRVFDGQLSEIFDAKLNHGVTLKDKYFRCRNNNDIVPRIVPLPYEHVGTEIYLDRQ